MAVLLAVLAVVLLFALREWRFRRLGWDSPHRVAVVLVQPSGTRLSAALVDAFFGRRSEVEAAIARQFARYSGGAGPPVRFTVHGPITEEELPPAVGATSLFGLLELNLELAEYADHQDELAGIDASLYDIRIYVRATESAGLTEMAEGFGQEGGRIGVVTTDITKEGVDFSWFVAVHEYFHTRGASDKYDLSGRARTPEGLADPSLPPSTEQPGIEIMARGRPLAGGREAPPGAPETWAVGRWTAEEIGWTRPLTD